MLGKNVQICLQESLRAHVFSLMRVRASRVNDVYLILHRHPN